jgi:drug/metabolite transporter (DMT)-like permease
MNGIGTTVIGIVLALVGAFINNFGVVLQKRQVNIKAPPEADEKDILDLGQFFKDPLWVLGIAMQTILYLPFLLLAFDYLKITMVQPISNAGIIFLVLGLILLVNEKLRKKTEYLGIGLLVFGVISIALGAVPVEVTIGQFLVNASTFWMITIGIIIGSAILIIPILKFKKARLMLMGLVIGNCYAIVALSLQIMDLGINDAGHVLAVLFIILGIVGAVIGTVFGIIMAQEAFKRGQAINIIPYVQITINILPILAGLYVFGQIITGPLFFWAGVISIIVGASLLSRFQ